MAIQGSSLVGSDYDKESSTMETYVETYLVTCDKGDGAKVAAQLLGVDITDPYAADNSCTLRSISSRLSSMSQTNNTFNVVYTFATGVEQESLAPWDRNPLYTWSTVTYQKEIWEDTNGNKIISTNGLPWQTQTMRNRSNVELTVQRFVQDFDATESWELCDCINDDDFEGAPPKTVQFVGMPQVNNTVDPIWGEYWSKTVTFSFQPEGFALKRIATGMQEIDPATNKLKPIISGGGLPVNEPVCLDQNGAAMAVGQPPLILEFQIYQDTDLSGLL